MSLGHEPSLPNTHMPFWTIVQHTCYSIKMTLNVSLKRIAFKFVHMDSNIEVVGMCIMLSIDHVYILIKRENAIVYKFCLQFQNSFTLACYQIFPEQ